MANTYMNLLNPDCCIDKLYPIPLKYEKDVRYCRVLYDLSVAYYYDDNHEYLCKVKKKHNIKKEDKMKQHITVEQLKGLSYEKQVKIATAIGQYVTCIRFDKNGDEYLILNILSEHITIGKMIEIIEPVKILRINGEWTDGTKRKWWFVEKDDIYFEKLKLCDALWEMMKNLL